MLQPGDLSVGTVPFGRRPALIIVDMSNGFTSNESPLGGDFDEQVAHMARMATFFRQRRWPVVFSTVVYQDAQQASVFRQHLPVLNMLTPDSAWVQIDKRLGFDTGDILIEKNVPSAFFNTGLDNLLRAARVDCLVIGGLTTSGCVRATVVDGLQYNWPCWVIPELCGDRNQQAHQANLHDMAAKYAEVVTLEAAMQHLLSLG